MWLRFYSSPLRKLRQFKDNLIHQKFVLDCASLLVLSFHWPRAWWPLLMWPCGLWPQALLGTGLSVVARVVWVVFVSGYPRSLCCPGGGASHRFSGLCGGTFVGRAVLWVIPRVPWACAVGGRPRWLVSLPGGGRGATCAQKQPVEVNSQLRRSPAPAF